MFSVEAFIRFLWKFYDKVLRQVCLGRMTALVLLQNLMPQFLTIKGHQLALLI
jgi:hypothetical protein